MSQAIDTGASVNRREFVACLLDACPDALVVTGLGSPTYDVFAAGDSDRYFYLWGAMGGTTTLALGLALAQPSRPVLVITGDGEQLMGIGGLATVAAQRPANLSIVVLDNGHYGETGMQRSHSSLGTRLVDVARGFGIEQAHEVRAMEEVDALAESINARAGLRFVQVRIKTEEVPRALPSRDGVHLKNRFRKALGYSTI
ncbi:MAG: aldehyde dehydrogenase [Burkholderiales bacterium]|nr:aldehyde dehydrogenase [Burkholderiales bacterium]MDE2395771.1 aldehyde dehydrogenase [Burkholderiales bacterium]MDE2454411.1 aldehyde dehydrogenase [Burkholderiales bacterium]